MKHETRESWLNAGLVFIKDRIEKLGGVTVPSGLRISVGFPGGRGKTNKAIGQCWPPELSSDKTIEMFVSPVLDDPSRVLDVSMHEVIHAAVGNQAGHKAPFKRVAIAVGLTGKMTATVASDDLKPILADWAKQLGPYPHSKLDLNSPLRIRQATRLIKLVCSDCGYTVRTTEKWIATGTPRCVCNDEPMERAK